MGETARIAFVHDWLTGMRGGEWVLHEMASLAPGAPIHTLVHARGSVSPELERHPIHTSFLQRLPGAARRYRSYLPLMPMAAESFDLGRFDLVLSSSHCVAKGVRPAPGATHIAYLHTPMRYVWHLYEEYARGRGAFSRAAMAAAAHYLRMWDVSSSDRVDHFLANSKTVARRIEQVYRREAEVIHPPVDTGFFTPAAGAVADDRGYYLMVTALVPYKRVELAMEALAPLLDEARGPRLLVVGSGPGERRLRRLAPRGVQFLGWQPREKIRDCYRGARALIFPGIEDFGMAPVEAMASGTPVVAYADGGVTESVRGPMINGEGPTGEMVGAGDAVTGVFFHPQEAAPLRRAVRELERMEFDPRRLQARAGEFSRARFRGRYTAAVRRLAGISLAETAAGDAKEEGCTDLAAG